VSILDRIVEMKHAELERAQRETPEAQLQAQLGDAPPVRSFLKALAAPGPIKLIAELKKASPSAGVIREDFDPWALADLYQRNGASAISVLTDEPFFQGSLDILRRAREAVSVPVLRKDFIAEPYQVFEARAAGADLVLLIVAALDQATLASLFDLTSQLGMAVLVETHSADEVSRALDLPRKGLYRRALELQGRG